MELLGRAYLVMSKLFFNKPILKGAILCFLVVSFFTSCGTCLNVNKPVPALTITSSVPDCDVYINGKLVGQTPYSHFSDKVDVKKITVKKEGYKTKSLTPRKLKATPYWNFFPWPGGNWIWGYFLDRSKSKCWKYISDSFYFYMEKE